MQSVLGGAVQRAGEAVSGALHTNKKLNDMKKDTVEPSSKDRQTGDWGAKATNTDIWLSVSTEDRQGPQLLEDNFGREKIHRFDHERIPERVVHARGVGAFGNFKLYESAEDVTCAKVLTDKSRDTPVFVRFSTVLGSRGSADTVRDVRGFAVKFYTDEGNWDIVGNDIPIFFIQDAIKFTDLIHAGKPEPDKEVPQAQTAHDNFWDFAYLQSEATAMTMWTMSDRGIPRSLRMIPGHGVNTYSLVNAEGVRSFVKFHFMPTLGVHSFVWDEALKLAGQDPDFHRKDLYDAIESGAFPTWRFGIQVCPESRQDEFDFDILDATKIWPEELLPIRYIGELTLNRNVDEYFTQTEQAAFCTSHVVPGIGFSDDPLLIGRNFSYFDTQLSRLGINWEELPINRPVCPVMNNNRDGQGRHRITKGRTNYYPNRHSVAPPATAAEGGYVDYAERVAGIKQRIHSKKFKDHISQAQLFYNSMSPYEQFHIQNAFGFELDHCHEREVYERVVDRLTEVDLGLAQAVAEHAGVPTPKEAKRPNHGRKSKNLSQLELTPEAQGFKPTIATRMIAIFIAEGFNYSEYEAVKGALTAAGALPFTIAPKRQPIKASNGTEVQPDHQMEGQRSTMYDALYIPGGAHASTLKKTGRVVHYLREAFGHCKAIGATGEAVSFVRDSLNLDEMVFSNGTDSAVVDCYGVVTAGGLGDGPSSIKEGLQMIKGANNFMDAFAFNISQHRNFQREMDGLTAMVAY